MYSLKKSMSKIKKDSSGFAERIGAGLTRVELELLVSFFAGLLDEHIDAIFMTAADEGFLTDRRAAAFAETQRLARLTSEAFMPALEGGND